MNALPGWRLPCVARLNFTCWKSVPPTIALTAAWLAYLAYVFWLAPALIDASLRRAEAKVRLGAGF